MAKALSVDFLVVGGGPAGAAAAIVLAKGGSRVAVVERTSLRQFRIGETLSSSITPLLAELGASVPNLCRYERSGGIIAAWGESDVRRKHLPILGQINVRWCVDRATFDRHLFYRAKAAGAIALDGSRLVAAEWNGATWEFGLCRNGRHETGNAAFAIDATGRRGANSLFISPQRLPADRLIGTAFRTGSNEPSSEPGANSALIESTPDGWWYSVGLPDGSVVAVFFTDGDLLPGQCAIRCDFLRRALESAVNTRDRCHDLDRMIRRACWKRFDAHTGLRAQPVGCNSIAVGDALCSFDPLNGEGVAEALRGGIQVARILFARFPNETCCWDNSFAHAARRTTRSS